MTEVNLEQAFEQLQETSKSQQQEIEALKTKLLYLTETEMVKTRAELKLNQKNLDNLTNAHGFTEKMVQNHW
jgi:cell division septum initiation protein DivIVA